MERKSEEILKELEEQNIPVYSFSRLECINNCKYEAYRSYILNDRDNAQNNIYGILGGRIHDVLEAMMNGTAKKSDLKPAMEQELEDMDMLGIDFPKGHDSSDSIRKGWIADMTHFCDTYNPPKGQFETETFLLYKTPSNNYVQGYIDLTRINRDNTISIYDYKTSSMYRGNDVKKHGRQLVLYALGKEQQGYKVKEIAWIMLRYCEVTYYGKKTLRSPEESMITKVVERKNLVRDLEDIIYMKLEKLGYEEIDIECMISEAMSNNEIPKEVEYEFTIKPHVKKYELTDETRNECIDYIDSTIKAWEELETDNEKNFSPLKFTKLNKKGEVKDDSFYCSALCGYSKKCPHFQTYLATKQDKREDDDLW